MAEKKFTFATLAALFLTLSALFAFNYVMDPYDVNGVFKGPYNSAKKGFYDRMRLGTLRKMRASDAQIIALGSSRMQFLDVGQLAEITGKTAYNLGVSGTGNTELLAFFYEALRESPEELLIGVEFLNFGHDVEGAFARGMNDYNAGTGERRDDRWLSYWTTHYLTLSATRHSVESLLDWGGEPGYGPDGSQTPAGRADHLERYDGGDPVILGLNGYVYIGLHVPEQHDNGTYRPPSAENRWELDEAKFSMITEMVTACEQHGVVCRFVLLPPAQPLLDLIYGLEFGPQFEQWKEELAERTGYWDFGGINSVTRDTGNFVDIGHLTQPAGRWVFERIYGDPQKVPEDFGTYVTQQNVEQHNVRLRPNPERKPTFPLSVIPGYLLHEDANGSYFNGAPDA